MARYLSQLDTADRQEPTEALAVKTERLKEKSDFSWWIVSAISKQGARSCSLLCRGRCAYMFST